MNMEFKFHKLSLEGMSNAAIIAMLFDNLLNELNRYCPVGRESALMRTKLEEACFYAKKAMAMQLENQE